MYCPNCGSLLVSDDMTSCGRCGWREGGPITNVGAFQRPPPMSRPSQGYSKGIADDPAMRLLIPVGRSIWAIAAGYLGLVSVLMCPAPLALITGIIAIMDIKQHPERHGMGRAIFGIVMGTIFSLLGLIGIVAALVK